MRKVSLAWYLGSALMLLACGDGNNSTSCAAGTESCNGACVPQGSCVSNSCPSGQELCNGACATVGACQTTSPCGVGQIICNNACFTGTVCPTTTSTGGQTAGQTQTTSAPATGGVAQTTTVVSTGGTGNTSTGGKTATGGKAATGGTTATGGSSAYVDPNPTVCADTATTSGKMITQYQRVIMMTSNNPGKSYYALANWWSVFNAQTVTLNGLGFTVQNPNNVTSKDGQAPIGYPSFLIGQYQDLQTTGSGMPKLVSSLTTVPIVFNTNIGSISNGDLNAAMDVWFNTSTAPLGKDASAPTGGYLMVWQHKPANKQPRGNVQMPGVTVGSVPGKWDVWSDGQCVSYVSTTVQGSLTFDLNDFIKHAVTNNKVVKSNWYLADIFAGFEIWSGGSGAQLSKFCAKVN